MLEAEYTSRHCAVDGEAVRCRLQTTWWMACLFCLLFTMGGFSCLYFVWQPYSAVKWLLTAAGINTYVLWLVWTGLGKNHSANDAKLKPDFGIANWLTIARAFLIGALGGFLFQQPPGVAAGAKWLIWLPAAIYSAAVLMDYVDGYVARVLRSETRLGEWLDTKIDALGLLVAPVLAIGYDRLPMYYIGASLAYYLLQFGIWYRKQNNRPVMAIKAHPAKRMIAGFQMGLVAVALLPIFSRPVMTIAATIFMIPLLAGFLEEALMVGGYTRVNDLQQTRWLRHIDYWTTKLLPVILRSIISMAGMVFLYEAAVEPLAGDTSAATALLNAAMPFDLTAISVFAVAAFMIAAGFLARIGALLLSIIVAGALPAWDAPLSLFLLLSCALTLMLTGSGIRSLWQPEDKLLWQRQG